LFSVFLEFGGLLLFSILTGLLVQLVSVGGGFETMLSEYLGELVVWTVRLEKANDNERNEFMPPVLFRNITVYSEQAFLHDHNLIVESFDFYQSLTPKDQTAVIKLLFSDFRRQFRFFFDPCEQGFINEAIIQMATRRWSYKTRPQMVHKAKIKMEEVYFLSQGQFGLFNEQCDRDARRPLPPFMLVNVGKSVGDYQVLFDL